MINEEYIIHVDASWNSKIPNNSFSAMIVYLNGEKICEDFKRIKCNRGEEESKGLIRALNVVCNKYYDKKKKQSFVFKTDLRGLDIRCDKILKNIRSGIKFCSNDKDYDLSATLSKYRNKDIKFLWIPREQNQEADRLANKCFEDFLIKLGFDDSKKYMRVDLEYTLNKWKFWFGDKKSLEYVNKLEEFINDSFC